MARPKKEATTKKAETPKTPTNQAPAPAAPAVTGYKKNSVSEGGVLMPIDIAIFCSNKASGLTIKHTSKVIKEKEADAFIKKCTFYHISHMFQKRKYDDKLKKDRYSTSYYLTRSNTITVKEYGKKIFTGTVDEWDERKAETTTIMVVHAICELEKKKGEFSYYRAAIFLTGSGRAACFDANLQDGAIFNLNGRKSTKDEREEKKFGEFVFHPLPIEPTEGKEYAAVNSETEHMSRLMKIYFEEKGLLETAKPVAPKPVNEANTEAPTAPAPSDESDPDGGDDDLPF